eukprot:1179389-Prorocentrum_minimum.AAC.3
MPVLKGGRSGKWYVSGCATRTRRWQSLLLAGGTLRPPGRSLPIQHRLRQGLPLQDDVLMPDPARSRQRQCKRGHSQLARRPEGTGCLQ